MSGTIVWTAEMSNALVALSSLPENLTYVEIARRLSERFGVEISKNACIGKARRMAQPPRPARPGKYQRPRSKVRVDAPIPPRYERSTEPGISIYQLLERENCHFPLAEFTDHPPYRYCGEPTIGETSWCKGHLKRVSVPAKQRWD